MSDNGNATLAGNLIQNSDQRLKTDIPIARRLFVAFRDRTLNPVTFIWIDPTKARAQLGFIAQQVQPIFPQPRLNHICRPRSRRTARSASTTSASSLRSSPPSKRSQPTSHRSRTPSPASPNRSRLRLTASRDRSNRTNSASARPASRQRNFKRWSPLRTARNPREQASATPASDDSQATDTPPVIQINGDNPAIIQVGATYNDLGATITGPQQDLNLGITTYVNGVEMSPVQIDTSTSRNRHHRLRRHRPKRPHLNITRTVIIEAPANDNQATSTPANDNSPPLAATSTSGHDNCTMTDPLIIDGMTYISIRDAAVGSRLSTEYLARLARQHRLRARKLGRIWFIETHSLRDFSLPDPLNNQKIAASDTVARL